MKAFSPATSDDDVLQELWKVKDDTAKRFRSVADYVQSLHQQGSKVTPNASRPRTRRKRHTPALER